MERSRRKIGDDELSQVHSSLIDLEAHPIAPIAVEIDQKLRELQSWLMERGWPDPIAILVLRNGEFDGETLEEPRSLNTLVEISDGRAEAVFGWRAIRDHFEENEQALSDEWYAAKLIGIGLEALHAAGNVRDRALVNFGWYCRDWETRRRFGPKARSKLNSEGRLRADPDGNRKARNAERTSQAREWHTLARRFATEEWVSDESRSITEIATIVHKRLAEENRVSGALIANREGMREATGAPPAAKTIHKIISPLRPKKRRKPRKR